jgi:hypothetical protein
MIDLIYTGGTTAESAGVGINHLVACGTQDGPWLNGDALPMLEMARILDHDLPTIGWEGWQSPICDR